METSNTIIPALPYTYDPEDTRIDSLMNQVASFCGKEFAEDESESGAEAETLTEKESSRHQC